MITPGIEESRCASRRISPSSSLAAWEKFRAQMFTGPQDQDNSQDELMVSGRQEFYTIEAEF